MRENVKYNYGSPGWISSPAPDGNRDVRDSLPRPEGLIEGERVCRNGMTQGANSTAIVPVRNIRTIPKVLMSANV